MGNVSSYNKRITEAEESHSSNSINNNNINSDVDIASICSTSITREEAVVDHTTTQGSPNDGEMEVAQPPEETEQQMAVREENDADISSITSLECKDDDKSKAKFSVGSVNITREEAVVDHTTTKDSPNDGEMEVAQPPEETEQQMTVREENDGDISSITSLECKDDDKPNAKFSVGSVVYARDRNWGEALYRGVIRRMVYGPAAVEHANVVGSEADRSTSTIFEMAHDATTATNANNAHECWYYYIHYYKWANKWERFVPEMDVFSDTEEVREKASQLAKANSNKKNKKRKGNNALPQPADQASQQQKQEEEEKHISLKQLEAEKEEEDKKQMTAKTDKVIDREQKLKEIHLGPPRRTVKYADRLFIPPPLQKILVEEWDLITANKRNDTVQRVLPNLPADVTVKDALDRYLQSKLHVLHLESNSDNNKNSMMKEEWMQMVDGIATLFDHMLPCAILYDQEIQQYKCMGGPTTVTKPSTRIHTAKEDGCGSKSQGASTCLPSGAKRNCEIYGCSYLLRLIVKLPQMLIDLPRQDLSITAKIGDLIHYLHDNNKVLFSQTYRKPLPDELTLEEREAKK
jgi:hypothetical protein